MAIISTDLQDFHSGGAGNSNQAADLGGAIGLAVTDNVDNNAWSDVPGAEAAAGSIKYRARYWKNAHGSLELVNAKFFIPVNTTSTDDTIAIAKGDEGAGDGSSTGVLETIADEDTAPVGPAFSAPATYASGIALSGMTTGKVHGYWERRTVTAPASAKTANSYQLTLQGETAE